MLMSKCELKTSQGVADVNKLIKDLTYPYPRERLIFFKFLLVDCFSFKN